MLPDTTVLKIVKDFMAKLSGEAPGEKLQNNVSLENEPAQTQTALTDTSPSAVMSESQVQIPLKP